MEVLQNKSKYLEVKKTDIEINIDNNNGNILCYNTSNTHTNGICTHTPTYGVVES